KTTKENINFAYETVYGSLNISFRSQKLAIVMDNDPHNIIGGTFPITMPYFSIIVPTYQAEATISTCLKSILAQDFVDFEVIIQDGLSTDQTVSLVKQHNDPRIRLFIEKDNGVYDAMNRA